MKIAIDAMGGDHAPKEIVLGALKAIETFQIYILFLLVMKIKSKSITK